MPVQRTREEEEKLHLQVLRSSAIISEDAANKMKRILDKMAQLENRKVETKK